jgi:hypothetical protein
MRHDDGGGIARIPDDFHLTKNIRSVRHQCGFGHRGKHTTCRPAKNEFPQPGMPVPAHDNEIGIRVGCI